MRAAYKDATNAPTAKITPQHRYVKGEMKRTRFLWLGPQTSHSQFLRSSAHQLSAFVELDELLDTQED